MNRYSPRCRDVFNAATPSTRRGGKLKALIILCLLSGACSAPVSSREKKGSFRLRVELVTGERSKDSSSQTTTISIAPPGDTIVWERTYSGFHGRTAAPSPVRKEYKLSAAEMRKLSARLESASLLVTKSITLPADRASHVYFGLSIESATAGGRQGDVNISGPRTAAGVREQRVYQDAVALVKELYEIINRHGGHEVFDELVIEKRIP